MKRSTKILIAATAVATVVSIGSVSYALWSAGGTKTAEVEGTTGAINTIGELTVTPSEASGSVTDGVISMNSLYPVDQGTGYRTYWEFEVTVTGEGKQTVTVKGELTKAVTGTGEAKLFYSATKPTGGAVSGAQQISGDDVEAQSITLDTDGKATVYIYMTADNTDAMKANIKLTFEASAAAE